MGRFSSTRRAVAAWYPWLVRVLWAGGGLFVVFAVTEAAGAHSRPVAVAGSSLVWTIWGLGLVAVIVPHPVGLVLLRVAGPASAAAAAWAIQTADTSASAGAFAAIASTALNVAVFSAETGAWCVNGPAYANERRFLLRPPAVLLFGPIPLAGLLCVLGPIAAPLLLAARNWVLGGAALALGGPAAVIAFRSLFGLSQRFLVFVPAGFVVHDGMSLREPVLFSRNMVRQLGPALADSTALDLSQRAAGLALELSLREPADLVITAPRRRAAMPVSVDALLVSPTRPGTVLAEARRRRVPVS